MQFSKRLPEKAPRELLHAAEDLIFKCLLTQVAAVKIQNQGTATVHMNELSEHKRALPPYHLLSTKCTMVTMKMQQW